MTSRVAVCGSVGLTFTIAFSTAIASTPNKQLYAPIARKNERHIVLSPRQELRAGRFRDGFADSSEYLGMTVVRFCYGPAYWFLQTIDEMLARLKEQRSNAARTDCAARRGSAK